MTVMRKKSGFLPNMVLLMSGLAVALAGVAPALAQTASLGSTMSPDGKVRIDIVSLKRTEGDTLTIRFQIANDSNQDYSVTVDNLRLIDIVGRRSYTPGVTGRCFAPVGQRFTCYAIFGAPPPGTRTMTVQFYERLDLISGVPISE